ncbi:MAG: glutaminyl-peptide cyclotransferase [Chloroflexi bacterium]|nr:glutaminyl-peptide cyclotransferase [Chloroflexota bacterium]
MKTITIIIFFIILTLPLQAQSSTVPVLVPQVRNVYPHDAGAFTQGLIWEDGFLYESTGLWGESTLRRVDLDSGESQEVMALADDYFAEGLERVGDQLIQLTWRAGLAFVYDYPSLQRAFTLEYEGEGWGLCYDDRYLFMSDGTSFLSVRDPLTFELIFRGAVTLDGRIIPPQLLNELECVGDHIYGNAWNTDYIFQIDKSTGEITALIDASALLTDAERAELSSGSVLNGIAWNPESETFYITGKNWPKLFEVIFASP